MPAPLQTLQLGDGGGGRGEGTGRRTIHRSSCFYIHPIYWSLSTSWSISGGAMVLFPVYFFYQKLANLGRVKGQQGCLSHLLLPVIKQQLP